MVGDGFPDIVVGFRGKDYKMEIKNSKANGKLRSSQITFNDRWKGKPVIVVKNITEALAAIGAISADWKEKK